MDSHTVSLAKRLLEAESPYDLEEWEQKDGYYAAACRISKDDVPELIEIALKWSDPDWPHDDLGLDSVSYAAELLPVTAWRTLADLKSSDSVEPLVEMLSELEDEYDDWAADELPHVFGKIGRPAVKSLVELAKRSKRPEFVRVLAAQSLQQVAEYHRDTRGEISDSLTELMSKAVPSKVQFNTAVLVGLVELRVVDATEAIERAFAANALDVGMIGDWEQVRQELGVEGLGLEMPESPYSSVEQLRKRMGIGIFSKEPIFTNDGLDEDAAQAYYEAAWNLFSESTEAEQVFERYDDLRWIAMFLEFGLNYTGESVDVMTVGTAEEFVFEYLPAKVSTESSNAASIIFELTLFWEYLNRVFELENAKSIIAWLKTGGIAQRLEEELSDSVNFGMAKSIMMSGLEAGFDMTSEEGMAAFIETFNQSLGLGMAEPITGAPPQRVGRNDPCPCGSGKKFKKCCR